jgi:hypothetical protein
LLSWSKGSKGRTLTWSKRSKSSKKRTTNKKNSLLWRLLGLGKIQIWTGRGNAFDLLVFFCVVPCVYFI